MSDQPPPSSGLPDYSEVDKAKTDSVAEENLDTTPSVPYSSHSLKVDYQWRKKEVKISMASDTTDKPVYIADYHWMTNPTLVIKRCSDDLTIGTGNSQAISINPSYTFGDYNGELRASSRFLTRYTFESQHYKVKPEILHWSANMGIKNWDFTCFDKDEVPVAKFHSNVWYIKKIGLLDFYEPCDENQSLREEIMVVAMTMYNQMLIRINSPLSILGMIPNPKPHKEEEVSSS
ncbi:hypothetical protein BD324DRAFT_629123 [Kockovaella imperatae]|uniref:Tubby C-terminal-like domain-containing protein n=1 Tax=Kockovaella imperatae TaxID=4999 RepID=A0A1Y1UG68_9TREE|nr:hypothetical protein BD324DRAFT_629123 [Kockovaella imperatae]ORX36506.1 hypothetical protein BD324DRAFT_629123 [Kockovaella imperatae]